MEGRARDRVPQSILSPQVPIYHLVMRGGFCIARGHNTLQDIA